MRRLALDAEAGRGVALRIEVDDQHVLADGGQRGAEIDRGRGLADAALLVGDGEDARRLRCSARSAGLPNGIDLRRRIGGSAGGLAGGRIGVVGVSVIGLRCPSFACYRGAKPADDHDAAFRAGLAGPARGLDIPIFSGFGQFSLYILSLGEQTDGAPLDQRKAPDRSSTFNGASARAVTTSALFTGVFAKFSIRTGCTCAGTPVIGRLRAGTRLFCRCFQPDGPARPLARPARRRSGSPESRRRSRDRPRSWRPARARSCSESAT